MVKQKISSTLFLFLFFISGIYAQSTLVRGVVVDTDGVPLPGVSVFIKNTAKGVITSMDGLYVISDVSPSDSISFSYIGFDTQTYEVGNRPVIDVILNESSSELEELTVVAFQKQKKESVIGSVTTLNPKELKVPQSNLTTALAGKMSGIISYQRSGEPGQDNADFFIRGVTTFGYKSSPLILIDGLEVTTEDLARLEPDNVATFSIMKDATATALYGARGANGVILVTTKTGKKGKMSISARVETSISTPTKMNEFVAGVTYMEMYNKALRTRNPNSSLYYSKDKIEGTRQGGDSQIYPNVDWYSELFRNSVQNYKANVSATGGGEFAQYYLTVSYTNEKGLLNVDPLNNFNNNIAINRYNVRANVDFNFTKTTKAAIKMYSLFDRYNGPVTDASDIFGMVMDANPVNFPKYYEKTGNFQYLSHVLFGNKGTHNATQANPYAEMVKGYKDRFTSSSNTQFQLEQDLGMITKGLKLRGLAAVNVYSYYETIRQFSPFYYEMKERDTEYGVEHYLEQIKEGDETLSTNSYSNSNSSFYFEAALQYDRTFAEKHAVGALLVATRREGMNEIGGSSTDLYQSLPSRNVGFAGRLTYAYDNRYFIEGNFGYNGSEKFSKENQWGFFPSAGLGWILSNEHFYGERLKKVLSLVKFKATYGLTGNDAISDSSNRFFYLSQVNVNDGGKGYAFGQSFNNWYNGYTIGRYANPNIGWEVSEKGNYGVEIGFFNKLTILADYFTENRSSIFMTYADTPASMGLTADLLSNIGRAKSWGVDASADFQWISKKDFWLTSRLNFTYATNEVLENADPDYRYDYLSRIGQPINQQWGYVAERLFIDEEDRLNSPDQFGRINSGNYLAGDIKYVDINDDGVINEDDQVAIGYPTVPEIIYGFGISSGWKNIDFSFFFQGSARSSFFITPEKVAPFVNERNALKVIADNYWSDENPDPYAFWPRLSTQSVENNEIVSTWWLRNGSFLRLKSMELGYSLPQRLLDKAHLSVARIYVSGTNLLCFSKFKLWDPEMGDNGLGYPPQRVFNIGLQLTF